MKTTSKTPYFWVLGVGLIIILLIALYLFLRETENTLVYFTLLVILALSAASLLIFLPGKITYNRGSLQSKGAFAAFAFVFLTGLGFYQWNVTHPQSFGLTVYIRDIHQQTVLRTGSLQLLVGNSRPMEAIDPSGSVFFRDIPAIYKYTLAQVELLETSEYQFTNGTKVDTLQLSNHATTLTVEPDGKRCCLRGLVVNQKGNWIVDAQVWTGNLTPVKTDSLGRFTIVLPIEQRMKETYDLFVRKSNVQKHIVTDHVQEPTVMIHLK